MRQCTGRRGVGDRLRATRAGILIVALLILLGAGCLPRENKVPPAIREKPVKVIPAREGVMERVLSFTGTVEPVEKAEIYSKIPGKIDRVYCREGDRVRRGDILIKIEDEDLKAAVVQAEAALKMARARLSQAQSGAGLQSIQTQTQIQQARNALNQAEASNLLDQKDLKRMESLFARGAITRQQLDVIETKELVSRRALDSARENLRLARASIAQNRIHDEDVLVARAGISQAEASLLVARTQLDYASITSPIAGVIIYRGVEPGEMVAASTMGRAAPLLRVVNNKEVNIEAQVPEKDVSLFAEGRAVRVVIDAVNPPDYRGRITAVVPAADLQSRSFKVKAFLPNRDGKLKSGMFARIEMVSYRNARALLIPREALQDHEGKKKVFIVMEDLARQREVKIGRNDENNCEILSGLGAGDRVVIAGQAVLNDGDHVKVEGGKVE